MAQSISDMSVEWADGTLKNGIKLNVTDTSSNASSLLMDLQVGSASKFKVDKAGNALVAGLAVSHFNPPVNNGSILFGAFGGFGASSGFATLVIDTSPVRAKFREDLSFGWTGSIQPTSATALDLVLARDAANTLAQRNGANAQVFRIYNNFSTASDFERGFMRWSSNVLEIGSEVGGTFTTARTLKLVNPTTIQITPSNAVLQIDANVRPTSNGSNNLGTDSVRWATTFTANVVQSGYQELAEMTAPAAPAADRVRIYAQDNGSGKTQLMALFATGAAVEIAIEP
jgi:hypothetical protein